MLRTEPSSLESIVLDLNCSATPPELLFILSYTDVFFVFCLLNFYYIFSFFSWPPFFFKEVIVGICLFYLLLEEGYDTSFLTGQELTI